MRRRHLLKLAATTAFAMATHKRTKAADYEFDKYGGWTSKKFKATGFFRTEKQDRWWLVTPEGNAFLSFGVNHLYPDLGSSRKKDRQHSGLLDGFGEPYPAVQKACKSAVARCMRLQLRGIQEHNHVAAKKHFPSCFVVQVGSFLFSQQAFLRQAVLNRRR